MVSTRQMTIGGSSCSSDGSGSDTGSGSGGSRYAKHGPSTSGMSTVRYVPPSTMTRSIHFLDLPPEIVEKIFSYLSFKNVCQLRLVCSRFDRISSHILNSTFQRLQVQMLNRFQTIKSKMPRRESARRTHPLACECDIIETLHMRLTLLQMSFGKHIERKHCCFFPGEILDEVFHILHYIKVTPKLPRPYNVTDELFDLSTMAMEYFKDKIEPHLPEIAYFGSEFFNFPNGLTSSPHHLSLDSSPIGADQVKDSSHSSHDGLEGEDLEEAKPQSNMVLRKRIRIIKQGMKRYNSQLSLMRQDLKACKRKTAEQQNQIAEQQKQLAEQQQQTLEYASRLDEYDKKNEEISRKFSTLLQELNKCKTELQYWRSKSTATPPFCTSCGNVIGPQPEEFEALWNQGVNPEGISLDLLLDPCRLEDSDPPELKEDSPESTSKVEPLEVKRQATEVVTAKRKRADDLKDKETKDVQKDAQPSTSSSKKTRRHSKMRKRIRT